MDNLKNLPPFYVGQKVVSLISTNIRKKGEIYSITDQFMCSCGYWMVSFGIRHNHSGLLTCVCEGCGNTNPTNSWFFAAGAETFAPLTESPFPSLTMEQVVKKEAEKVCMN